VLLFGIREELDQDQAGVARSHDEIGGADTYLQGAAEPGATHHREFPPRPQAETTHPRRQTVDGIEPQHAGWQAVWELVELEHVGHERVFRRFQYCCDASKSLDVDQGWAVARLGYYISLS